LIFVDTSQFVLLLFSKKFNKSRRKGGRGKEKLAGGVGRAARVGRYRFREQATRGDSAKEFAAKEGRGVKRAGGGMRPEGELMSIMTQ